MRESARTPAKLVLPRSFALALALSALLFAGLLFAPRAAFASLARQSVDAANTALAATPPQRDAARSSLRAAVSASDDADAVSEASFLLAQLDEEDGAYPQALADDRAAIDAAPASRWAVRASERIDWLRARSEGDFAPLRQLEAVRHDPSLSSNPASIESLARDADGFPPGMVRVEARMLVAEAWLVRLDRPNDAIEVLRKVCDEKKIDPLTQRFAERELVEALVAQGRIDEAIAEANARPARFDPKYLSQVRRLRTRRDVRWASAGVLAVFALFAIVALGRAARDHRLGAAGAAVRSLAPAAGLFVAFVAGVGGLLASEYETGNAGPFLVLGAGVLPLVLLARAWSAVGSRRPSARVARSILCAVTVMAAAFQLLETTNPQYLVGFGL